MCNLEAAWKGCYSPLLVCNSFSTSLVWQTHSVNSHHLRKNDMHVLSNTYVNTGLSVFTVTRFMLVDAVDSWRFIISTNGFAIQLLKDVYHCWLTGSLIVQWTNISRPVDYFFTTFDEVDMYWIKRRYEWKLNDSNTAKTIYSQPWFIEHDARSRFRVN